MLADRQTAGRLLAEKLTHIEDPVVIAIPTGGVVVGSAIADTLGCPLDVAFVHTVPHPENTAYAIGIASSEGVMIHGAASVPPEYVERTVRRICAAIFAQRDRYYRMREPVRIAGKTPIIADDGSAGLTTLVAAANFLRKRDPKRICIAMPVASQGMVEHLGFFADEMICLNTPESAREAREYYERFEEVSEDEAVRLFERR